MNKKSILKSISPIVEEAADKLGYELVEVEFEKEGSDYYLRMYIYKEDGINFDDCKSMSELVSEKLDEEDPIDMPYYLEVSSPGLDRPLKTDDDLRRNLGKEIELSLYKNIDGIKKIQGFLESYDDDTIKISVDKDEDIILQKENISLIKLVINF